MRNVGGETGGGQRGEGKSLEAARGAGEMEVVVQPVRAAYHAVGAGRVHKERISGEAVRVVAGGLAPFEHVVLVAQPRAEGRASGGNDVVVVAFHETGRIAVHVRVAHQGVAAGAGGPDDVIAVGDIDGVSDVDAVAAIDGVVLDERLLGLPEVGRKHDVEFIRRVTVLVAKVIGNDGKVALVAIHIDAVAFVRIDHIASGGAS